MSPDLEMRSLQIKLVKLRLLKWALIQHDWCLSIKENLGHRDRHDDGVEILGERCLSETKQRGLEEDFSSCVL